jgi:hypothetical protein
MLMTSKILAGIAALALAIGTAPMANAAKTMHPQAAHHAKYFALAKGKICKGEFMYMKGGKCMDARDKTTKA